MDLSRTVLAVQSEVPYFVYHYFHVSLVSWASSRDFQLVTKRDQIFVVLRLWKSHYGKGFRKRLLEEKLFINLNYPNYYVYQFKCF